MFDAIESERLKQEGMELAREASVDLDKARAVARGIALAKPDRTCTADEVGRALGGVSLGPAAGSIFRGSEWEFTGRRIRSSRVSNHARELKVWRLSR